MRSIRVALATLAGVLVLGAATAAAETPNHAFLGTLVGGTEAVGPAPPGGSPPLAARLDNPCGVAVSSSGLVFTAEYTRSRILAGQSRLAANFYPENGPCGLATDGAELFVNYFHGGVVLFGSGQIDPGPATGIAVDPATHDLYVDKRSSIAIYTAPVEPGDAPALEIGSGNLGDGYGVAVSDFPATDGWVFVADAASDVVKAYDPSSATPGVPVEELTGKGTAAGHFVSLTDSALAFDQSNGHLFVVDDLQPGFDHPQAAAVEYNSDGIFRGQLDHQLVAAEPTGITVDESETAGKGNVYVTSGNGVNTVVPTTSGPPAAELGALYAFGPAGAGHLLKVKLTGTGSGSVTSNPIGVSCPGSCEAELNDGALVALTATPAPGSAFAGWSGPCTGAGKCQFSLEAATTVEANFVPAPTTQAASSRSEAPAAAPADGAAKPLRLGRARFDGGSVVLPVEAPAAGTLTVRGADLRPIAFDFAAAGKAALRLRLDPAGRRRLARAKAARLAIPVVVGFRRQDGKVVPSAHRVVTFVRPVGK